ncbi:hypothetical protein [Cyanobium sp. Morenito 9A2]|uniref:hypothetical protein n=1 Tax=Cyanobium sp. Morenito 9A2 TaxID=2823718 RepID=UPI0020CE4621|nr:hypothetical protein [Cyanobium sp. Morenito 9A2]MCP9850229.1 hypothetical protein [Cyanobium sp. Morenito 9A2]
MDELSNYQENVTSQNGEDGILREIFRRIGVRSKLCIEFGAWDGIHLSNTWELWHQQGWSALLIEGDRGRHEALAASLSEHPRAKALLAYVNDAGPNSLDSLLAQSCLAEAGIDLLSIDIDGDDYHVWQSLKNYRPRVVVIEYNPSIPPELELVQKKGEYFGASAGALLKLAHEKEYLLAACTATNCLFICKEDFEKLQIIELVIHQAFDRSQLTYAINAYDGQMFLTRCPIFSHSLPEATATHWWRLLLNNLLGREETPSSPVQGITPVSVTAKALTAKHSLPSRISSALKMRTGRLITSLPPYRAYERCADLVRTRMEEESDIRHWRQAGKPLPPPHAFKQRLLSSYSRKHKLRSLVETGTYLGDMVHAMRRHFQTIISVELSPELCEKSRLRFAAYPHITILQGDSGKILPIILSQLQHPTLFWLDGHYSAGITARGSEETPVSAEIGAILDHDIKGHVILIDDARNFDGTHDYPTYESLRSSILLRKPMAIISCKEDIIRVVL